MQTQQNATQLELDFTSPSPINREKLSGQNRLVYDTLKSGGTINCFQAQELFITALNSRISDLRNRWNIRIYDRFIKTKGGSNVKEYSLKPFDHA